MGKGKAPNAAPEDVRKPECALTWRGPGDNWRVAWRMGHPDRLTLKPAGARAWIVDLWLGTRQKLYPGCVVVVERGGRAVVV